MTLDFNANFKEKFLSKKLKILSKYNFAYLMLFFGCKSCDCVIWRGCNYIKLWYNWIKLRKER